MSARSVIHDTFTIQRTYPVSPEQVFGAFASVEAKNVWGDTGNLESVDDGFGAAEFDFRVGGRERFAVRMDGVTFRYDALYYDIIPNERIVYAYEMYANDVRISVSVTTIQFVAMDGGTNVTYTEQGVYLDGFDGVDAPRFRHEGTTDMIDNLKNYLAV